MYIIFRLYDMVQIWIEQNGPLMYCCMHGIIGRQGSITGIADCVCILAIIKCNILFDGDFQLVLLNSLLVCSSKHEIHHEYLVGNHQRQVQNRKVHRLPLQSIHETHQRKSLSGSTQQQPKMLQKRQQLRMGMRNFTCELTKYSLIVSLKSYISQQYFLPNFNKMHNTMATSETTQRRVPSKGIICQLMSSITRDSRYSRCWIMMRISQRMSRVFVGYFILNTHPINYQYLNYQSFSHKQTSIMK